MPTSSPAAELLSPAGNWECARAAVANGADAIYFGMPEFNARLRADNFSAEDLPELMLFLHDHGVRGFVAFNTLIFTTELDAAERQLRLLEDAGVDAIIVQDIGLALLAREITPRLELHASTQMTITSPEGLSFIHRALDLDRAVLSRELSLKELDRFTKGEEPGVPLEVFVHGALCVAYSGQCLTSESLGQRSANRGECAQACRMPYELVVDGETRELGDQRYLLSPQDLAAADIVPELIASGVYSFKIEGRLKSPEYVAAVTRTYRKAIDSALDVTSPFTVSTEDKYALEMTFSRGLSTGWLEGVDHPKLTHGRWNKKRGAYLGTVTDSGYRWVELDEVPPHVKKGDGIVFATGVDTNFEMGGRLFEVVDKRLTLDRLSKAETHDIPAGTPVFKTSDHTLDKELRGTWKGNIRPRNLRALTLRVSGEAGRPLVLESVIHGVHATSKMPLETATSRPLTDGILTKQLGRLGGTPFALEDIRNDLVGDVILPVSELNRLRRDLVEKISLTPPQKHRRPAVPRPPLPAAEEPAPAHTLTVLCRSDDQLEASLDAGVETVYLDYEDIRRYPDAVRLARETRSNSKIFLSTPRIQKPGEGGYFKLIERAEPDGVLVRNLGGLTYFKSHPSLETVGDFSLNVANPVTADFFRRQGLGHLTISYDLNITQVLDLLRGAPPEWFELTLHQHMPMFHMEHCVYCTFLSDGHNYTDCGRPCEKHKVQLRDRVGQLHTLQADVGCRNTLFRGQAQSAARFFEDLSAAGLRRSRIELLDEGKASTELTIRTYQRLLSGQASGATVHQSVAADSRLGVVEGTLRDGG